MSNTKSYFCLIYTEVMFPSVQKTEHLKGVSKLKNSINQNVSLAVKATLWSFDIPLFSFQHKSCR